MELIEELGLQVHSQYSKGAKFARLSDGKIRKYSSSLPKISPLSLLDIYFFINKVRCGNADHGASKKDYSDGAYGEHGSNNDGSNIDGTRK